MWSRRTLWREPDNLKSNLLKSCHQQTPLEIILNSATFSIDFIGLTKQADVSTTLWMFWRWLLIANLSKWEHGAIGTVCKFLHKLQNLHLQPIHLGTISNYKFFFYCIDEVLGWVYNNATEKKVLDFHNIFQLCHVVEQGTNHLILY